MGTHRLLPLLCLFLLGVSSAQQAPPSRFKVEGVVINSANGKPLPRALVVVSGHAMLTGPEGEFAFDGVPAGPTQIQFHKPGYFAPGAKFINMGPVFTSFMIGPDTGKIVLKLLPEAVISGRVTGQDEEPLEGANIEVLTYNWEEGRRILVSAPSSAQTDEDGYFRVARLAAGKYILVVKTGNLSRRVLGQQTEKASTSYPAITYYPGTSDLDAAAPIDLAAGQKVEAQFSLSLLPAYKLAGRVVATGEWKQVTQPMIVDSQNQWLAIADVFDAASGTFEFRAVPAGTYTVRVQGQDARNYPRFTDQKITVSQNVTNLQLVLKPGISIPVLARTEFSKPPPTGGSCDWQDPGGEHHHSDCSDYPAARVELISIDSRSQFDADFKPVHDQSGYAVTGVPPGKYIVRAMPGFTGYVQSVRSGNLDLFRDLLTVPEDGNVAPIEVVVRDDSGMLRVAVHSEKAGQTAVALFRDGTLAPATTNSMRTVVNGGWPGTTDARVFFAPLAPGNYKVVAIDCPQGWEALGIDDPEVLATYLPQATSVTVAANGDAAITVDVIHKGE